MSETKNNIVAVDTSVIVAYLSTKKDTQVSKNYIAYLERELFANETYQNYLITSMTKTELLYILCRMKGWDEANEYIEQLLENFLISRDYEVEDLAALIKCKFPISLSDCFTLGVGMLFKIPVFFLEEKELTENIQERIRNELQIQLHILKKL